MTEWIKKKEKPTEWIKKKEKPTEWIKKKEKKKSWITKKKDYETGEHYNKGGRVGFAHGSKRPKGGWKD